MFLRIFNNFFSSSKSFLYQCKNGFFCIKSEITLIVNFQNDFGNSLLKLFLLLPALKNIQKIHVSICHTNSGNKDKIILFSSDISITFL